MRMRSNAGGLGSLGGSSSSAPINFGNTASNTYTAYQSPTVSSELILADQTGTATVFNNATSPTAGTDTVQQMATSAVTGVPISQLTSPTSNGLPANLDQYTTLTAANANQINSVPTTSGSLANIIGSLFGSGKTNAQGVTISSGMNTSSSGIPPVLLIVGAALIIYLLASKRK